jgi:hypothetical protein
MRTTEGLRRLRCLAETLSLVPTLLQANPFVGGFRLKPIEPKDAVGKAGNPPIGSKPYPSNTLGFEPWDNSTWCHWIAKRNVGSVRQRSTLPFNTKSV